MKEMRNGFHFIRSANVIGGDCKYLYDGHRLT